MIVLLFLDWQDGSIVGSIIVDGVVVWIVLCVGEYSDLNVAI